MSSSMSPVLGSPVPTTRFGTLTTYQPLVFTRPILGFEAFTQYSLLPDLSGFPEESPLVWLQSLQSPGLAFVLTQPHLFHMPYELDVPDDCLLALELEPKDVTPDDLQVYTLVTIPDANLALATTNLLAPIIIAPAKGTAVQWVLNNPNYPTKALLVAQTQSS
jgi:flagellar assembly factor FliW